MDNYGRPEEIINKVLQTFYAAIKSYSGQLFHCELSELT